MSRIPRSTTARSHCRQWIDSVARLMEDIVERQLVCPKSASIPILQAFIGPSGAVPVPPNNAICTLACVVIACKQLWANDPSGKSDPYVVVSLGGQSRQTETIDDSLIPTGQTTNRSSPLMCMKAARKCIWRSTTARRTRATSSRTHCSVWRRFRASHSVNKGSEGHAPFEGSIELKLPLDTSVYDGKLEEVPPGAES